VRRHKEPCTLSEIVKTDFKNMSLIYPIDSRSNKYNSGTSKALPGERRFYSDMHERGRNLEPAVPSALGILDAA
jgi:hypothetical protein